jgi:hypothetical protein
LEQAFATLLGKAVASVIFEIPADALRKPYRIALAASLQISELSIGADEEGDPIGLSPDPISMKVARQSDLHANEYMMHIRIITRLYIDLWIVHRVCRQGSV